jgi:hypothetical protein|tara:strand:- start:187 stop:777 length:591 start_codon:yes stop_codon:yes gene_type:complete
MEFILDLAVRFWMWTVVIILIIIGLIINFIDKKQINKPRVNFKYKDYPHMKPIRIATKDKGFWSAVIMWLLGGRRWEISKDFVYELNGVKYVIPKGFTFDGASVPKFLATFLSPVGVLLLGGLIHDYAYKYAALKPALQKSSLLVLNQKQADKIFRDINIEVNGFYFLNYLAYWALRLGGWLAWNGHRKRNAKIGE